MKFLVQLSLLTVFITLGATAFTPKAFAQAEVIPITVPYELTNLDERVTKLRFDCEVTIDGGQRWGSGHTVVDIAPPNSSGSAVVNVYGWYELLTISQLLSQDTGLSSRYECTGKVAIDGGDAGWQRMDPNSRYPWARSMNRSNITLAGGTYIWDRHRPEGERLQVVNEAD